MSLLADFRSTLPEPHSPELRDLILRLDDFERRIEARLDAAERLASERHGWTMEAIARLAEINEIKERLVRVEGRHT
jgi:hypothetical protein